MAIVLLGAPPLGRAEDPPARCPICQTANDPKAGYGRRASTTLLRGAINAGFGWTELLVNPAEEVNAGGRLLVGVGRGMGLALTRTASGLGELLTFWAPRRKDPAQSLATDCPICRRAFLPKPPGPPASPDRPKPRSP